MKNYSRGNFNGYAKLDKNSNSVKLDLPELWVNKKGELVDTKKVIDRLINKIKHGL